MKQIIKNQQNDSAKNVINIEAIIKQNYKLLQEILGFRFSSQSFIGRQRVVSRGLPEVIFEFGKKNIMNITEYIELTAGTYPNPAIEIKINFENKTAEAISKEVIGNFALIGGDTEKRESFNIYLNDWLSDLKRNGASIYSPRRNNRTY